MDTPETRWLTYREMADALGLPSAKAALNRSRREGWPRQENNLRMAMVAVPVALLDAAQEAPPEPLPGSLPKAERDPPPGPDQAGGGTPRGGRGGEGVAMVLAELRSSHAAHLVELQQVVGRLERERDAARGEAAAARRELAEVRDQRDAEAKARAKAEGERDTERDRAERAEAARDATGAELGAWRADGPLRRAARAFFWRKLP